jgi:hypothetical protein
MFLGDNRSLYFLFLAFGFLLVFDGLVVLFEDTYDFFNLLFPNVVMDYKPIRVKEAHKTFYFILQ